MAHLRVLAASLLLVGSQMAAAEQAAPAPGAAPSGPPAGYGAYAPGPYGPNSYNRGPYGGGPLVMGVRLAARSGQRPRGVSRRAGSTPHEQTVSNGRGRSYLHC